MTPPDQYLSPDSHDADGAASPSRRSYLKAMTGALAAVTAACGTFNITEALAQSGATVAGGASALAAATSAS